MTTSTQSQSRSEPTSDDVRESVNESLAEADAAIVITAVAEGDGARMAVAKFVDDDLDEDLKRKLHGAIQEVAAEHFGGAGGPGGAPVPPELLAALFGGDRDVGPSDRAESPTLAPSDDATFG